MITESLSDYSLFISKPDRHFLKKINACPVFLKEPTKMYRNYIFDLYGTLLDINTNEGKPYLWKKTAELYAYHGAYYTPKELRAAYLRLCGEHTQRLREKNGAKYPEIQLEYVFEDLFREKGVNLSMDIIRTIGQTFRVISTKFLCLYDGVTDFLDAIHAAGKKVYLLSNAQEMFTKHEMIAVGIYDKFDGIVFSSDEGLCKPEERFFRTVVERYGLNIDESIMIGNDANTDILGANTIGMDSLYIHSDISPQLTDPTGADIPATYRVMDGDFTKIKQLIL